MKKLMLSAGVILLLTCINAKAQTHVGIKGGVNFSNVTNINGDTKVSGQGGLFVHNVLNKSWCIQPELLYSAQGEKDFTENGVKNNLNLNYIQLPVMFQYNATRKFYLEAGPQAGYLVSAKREGPNDNKTSVRDNYKKFDFGVNAGVGVNATKNIGIFARYNLGLMDIAKSDDVNRKNRNFAVGAAIRFQ